MEFALYVSYDLGITFVEHKRSSSLEYLEKDYNLFEKNWLRWYINDEKNKTIKICTIYQKIMEQMDVLKQQEEPYAFATDDVKIRELLAEFGVCAMSSDEVISKMKAETGMLN